jgi:DNA invertase Pin-like site-specific DNA recombinase
LISHQLNLKVPLEKCPVGLDQNRIAKAKEKGIYKGRKPKLCISKINGLLEQGMNNTEIAKELGVTYRSITRIIAKNRTDS